MKRNRIWLQAILVLALILVLGVGSEGQGIDTDPVVYVVQPGDTLAAIALRYGVALEAIVQENGIQDRNLIQVGQELIIPTPDTSLPTPTPLPTDIRQGTIVEYTVLQGDSLLSIALQFNSTIEAIKEENELENENEIFIGQVLLVPVNLVTPVPTETATATLDPNAAATVASGATATP